MKKVWLFFEMVEKDHTSIFRGIATTVKKKADFEKSLTDEMRLRKTKNWWVVEESLADHLYASSVYKPSMLAWKRYTMNGRAIDGD
jgi:hypothetical protein